MIDHSKKNINNPQENYELTDVHERLYKSLFKESGRGAILVATTIIEEQLTSLIEVILPVDMNKKTKKKLFDYPGPLSSFASKTHISYAFRLIDKDLYESLNSLRDIRNVAAHSPSVFELHQLNVKLKKVYNLSPTLPTEIKDLSSQMLHFDKTKSLNEFFAKYKFTQEEKAKRIQDIFNDKKNIELFEKEIPFWELINGLYLLCGLLINNKKKLSALTKDIRTWSEII
jgi:DNA-binding MltR family transcriptional regulator